jgi:hypothetical protein
VYALNAMLDVSTGSPKGTVLTAALDHVLAKAQLQTTYQRRK